VIYGLKYIAKYTLGLDQAGRNFRVFPDDTMIVSYPRSGNTWMRFLIANILHPATEVDFVEIERLIPDTSSISSRALKRIPRPRVIKTHEYFDHRYPKLVYVVRDPRDVALSYYNFQRKYRQIDDAYPLDIYVNDFVQGRLISRGWGTWAENAGSWLAARSGDPNFFLLRFEDMLEGTQSQLARLSQFLGVPSTAETIERAITRSSAEQMRELEKQQQDHWVATKKHRKDIPFVGAAKAGGWKTKLPEPCVRKIEAAWGHLMLALNYELATDAYAQADGAQFQLVGRTV
jgi:Sulfotransferase domain